MEMPPPHTIVQGLQLFQFDTTQFTGHAEVLHVACWDSTGHATPPRAVAATTERVRVLAPAPHDLVQADKTPQADTLQSTGQRCMLQTRSSSSGRATPPCMAATATVGDLVCEPLPQVLVQADQACQLCAQSMGQGWVLQSAVSADFGQAAPPWAAATLLTGLVISVIVAAPPVRLVGTQLVIALAVPLASEESWSASLLSELCAHVMRALLVLQF